METGMKPLEVRQEIPSEQTQFWGQNHPQNMLVSNAVQPNPTKSQLKNKSASISVPFLFSPCLPVVQTLSEDCGLSVTISRASF